MLFENPLTERDVFYIKGLRHHERGREMIIEGIRSLAQSFSNGVHGAHQRISDTIRVLNSIRVWRYLKASDLCTALNDPALETGRDCVLQYLPKKFAYLAFAVSTAQGSKRALTEFMEAATQRPVVSPEIVRKAFPGRETEIFSILNLGDMTTLEQMLDDMNDQNVILMLNTNSNSWETHVWSEKTKDFELIRSQEAFLSPARQGLIEFIKNKIRALDESLRLVALQENSPRMRS